MAKEERPSMPWYMKDWLSSEDRARMTYEARGIYRELLDYSWLHHGIPADKQDLAQWLGIPERKFALNWSMMAACWAEHEGRYYNGKQERVRAELEAFKASKSAAGKLGGRPRKEKQTESTLKANGKQTESRPPESAESKQKPSSASASASASAFASPPPSSSAPLVMSPLAFERAREKFVYFGSRLRVPPVLHEELRAKLGGLEPHARLVTWYDVLNAAADSSGEPIPDVFKWLRPKFEAWAGEQVSSAELEKFRPKGA
jgi:uncharacterized protein YdaU (DUF1376 family)